MNNLNAYRGDTLVINGAVTDSAGAVQNIAGWTIFFTLKLRKDQGDTDTGVIEKSGVIVSEAGGTFTVTLTASDTDNLIGSYYYDIQYKDTGNIIGTISEGVITFTEDVTRRIA
jgi:hypothetical protein